jgi:hypothetical protein
MTTRIYFGEIKLVRPVSFRLPDPEYQILIIEKGDGKLSDLLRDIIAQHIRKENAQPEIPLHVNSRVKK